MRNVVTRRYHHLPPRASSQTPTLHLSISFPFLLRPQLDAVVERLEADGTVLDGKVGLDVEGGERDGVVVPGLLVCDSEGLQGRGGDEEAGA